MIEKYGYPSPFSITFDIKKYEVSVFKLTKFTGEEFLVNPDVIKCVEHCGDTIITLVTGERILVKESIEEVRESFMAYKIQVQSSLSSIDPSAYAGAKA